MHAAQSLICLIVNPLSLPCCSKASQQKHRAAQTWNMSSKAHAPVVPERLVEVAQQLAERLRERGVLRLGRRERALEPALLRLLLAQFRVDLRRLHLLVARELDAQLGERAALRLELSGQLGALLRARQRRDAREGAREARPKAAEGGSRSGCEEGGAEG